MYDMDIPLLVLPVRCGGEYNVLAYTERNNEVKRKVVTGSAMKRIRGLEI